MVLVFRLSSLGDLILATSALENSSITQCDWVVGSEFAGLLTGHPKIRKIIAYDRKSGLNEWVKLCKRLWREDYELVFDLHLSLRTWAAFLLFKLWNWQERKTKAQPWRRISKQRIRRWAYFILKHRLPKSERPRPWVQIFSEMTGGPAKPNLKYLLKVGVLPQELKGVSYFAIMPSSLWPGKRWSVDSYIQVLKKLPGTAVILGTAQDVSSLELYDQAKRLGLPCISGVGKWNFNETAHVLASAQAYFGSDTGLSHLSEALGTRAFVIFGPTTEDLGFGPWQAGSVAMGSDLWCRPCSKDGRACYYVKRPYRCLESLTPEHVWHSIESKLKPRDLSS